ncbi:hypothetical protein A1507_12985 [Methylomonas koyamae]|uniref:Uncharacterized protein n=1 Tax=Methylomonas koyamae TaxID=702114 RepID=A0A177NCV5_9GAMM|nr:hypothetical protein A1507_12985 [Methylomonas koyamae]
MRSKLQIACQLHAACTQGTQDRMAAAAERLQSAAAVGWRQANKALEGVLHWRPPVAAGVRGAATGKKR